MTNQLTADKQALDAEIARMREHMSTSEFEQMSMGARDAYLTNLDRLVKSSEDLGKLIEGAAA